MIRLLKYLRRILLSKKINLSPIKMKLIDHLHAPKLSWVSQNYSAQGGHSPKLRLDMRNQPRYNQTKYLTNQCKNNTKRQIRRQTLQCKRQNMRRNTKKTLLEGVEAPNFSKDPRILCPASPVKNLLRLLTQKNLPKKSKFQIRLHTTGAKTTQSRKVPKNRSKLISFKVLA